MVDGRPWTDQRCHYPLKAGFNSVGLGVWLLWRVSPAFETCSPPTCRAALDDVSEAAQGLSMQKAASASDSLQALGAMAHYMVNNGLQVN